MANKTLNTRISQKYDSYAEWIANDPALLKGEIAVVSVNTAVTDDKGNIVQVPNLMMKVGEDGVKKFSELPWVSAKAADVADWAKAAELKADAVKGLGDYIATYVDETLGISVDTNTVYRLYTADNKTYKLQSKAAGEADTSYADVTGSEFTVDFTDVNNEIAGLASLHAENADGNKQTVAEEISAAIGAFETDLNLPNTYVAQEEGKGLSEANFTEAEKTKLGDIAEGANKYEHAKHTAYESSLYKITVDEEGHVSAATAVTKDDLTVGLGLPAQDTTYNEATASASGLMSATDKAKLNNIAENATEVYVDDTLSTTSTHAIENKAVTLAINALKGLHADGTDGEKQTVSEEISAVIDGLKLSETYADKTVYEKYVEDNDKAVTANTAAIEKLNGDDKTEGSVDYKVAQEVAKIINDNDDAAIDTLEEIAAWIVNDKTGAAEISNKANANAAAIADILKDATIKTFKGIEDKIGGLTGDNTVAAEIAAAKKAAVDEAKYDDKTVKQSISALEGLHAEGADGVKQTVSEEISGAISGLVEDSHTHDNQTELDKIVTGDKAKWDAAADRIGTADDILIFDCGTASTVI